jgi:hypothetical protein
MPQGQISSDKAASLRGKIFPATAAEYLRA